MSISFSNFSNGATKKFSLHTWFVFYFFWRAPSEMILADLWLGTTAL